MVDVPDLFGDKSSAPEAPKKPEMPTTGSDGVVYYRNISGKPQGVVGPDSASRTCPPGAFIHISQFQNTRMPDKAAKIGHFLRIKKQEIVAKAASKKTLVIGGPLNNAKGTYNRQA